MLWYKFRQIPDNIDIHHANILQASTLQHISSSTEDLILLFEAEREAVQIINNTRVHGLLDIKFNRKIDKYFQLIDYNM